jgi:hypothetical protein
MNSNPTRDELLEAALSANGQYENLGDLESKMLFALEASEFSGDLVQVVVGYGDQEVTIIAQDGTVNLG